MKFITHAAPRSSHLLAAIQCVEQAAGELALLSAPALADVLVEPLLVGGAAARSGRPRAAVARLRRAAPLRTPNGASASAHLRARTTLALLRRPSDGRRLAFLAPQSVKEFLKFEVVVLWACYGQPPPSPLAAAAAGAAHFVPEHGSGGGIGGEGGCGSGGGGGRRSSGAGGSAVVGLAGSEAYRPAAELLMVVPLVRFVLMSEEDLQVRVGRGRRALAPAPAR
jgi:uncharacterized membrane protein YgcG